MKKSNKVKENKSDFILIRVTEKEKKKLKKRAASSEQGLSQYLIDCGLGYRIKAVERKQEQVKNAVIVQQICNYIKENYSEDTNLEKWGNELWDSLS